MDKEERRNRSVGDRPDRHKFRSWRLRSHWELESVGPQALLPESGCQLWLLRIWVAELLQLSPQCNVQHWSCLGRPSYPRHYWQREQRMLPIRNLWYELHSTIRQCSDVGRR